jgi:cyanophycin synthetase
VNGVKVLLDFGHNPEGVRVALAFAKRLHGEGPGRLAVISGHAGDRTEADIAGVADVITAAKPELVVLRDIDGYLRGRAPGEVPQRFREHFLTRGFSDEAVQIAPSEVDALRLALDWARPGDMVALLVYLDIDGDGRLLAERGATYAG